MSDKKIIEIVEVVTKHRITLPLKVRNFMHLKQGDYVAFVQEGKDVLLSHFTRKFTDFDLIDDTGVKRTKHLKEPLLPKDSKAINKSKSMTPAHSEILSLLKEGQYSGKEIAERTGLSYDGVRGRISELKYVFGFNIVYKKKIKKYKWESW